MVLNMKEELGAWHPVVETFLRSNEGVMLGTRLAAERLRLQPELPRIFRALKVTQPHQVKVVILGQDPYPKGHADGLAFSSGIQDLPHSLRRIYQELEKIDVKRKRYDLLDWAEQGVLLLNTSLSTVWGASNVHNGIGWRPFVERILEHTRDLSVTQPIAYLGWGTPARQRISALEFHDGCMKLECYTNHPAARDGYLFNAANHFLLVNKFLEAHKVTPIKWND